MTSSTLAKFEGRFYPLQRPSITSGNLTYNFTITHETTHGFVLSNNEYLSDDPDTAKIMISTCLTFFTGIFHVNYFCLVKLFLT